MFIVDSQVHIWGANTPERPWPSEDRKLPTPHREVPLGADEVIQRMDAAGVSRAILVPPSYEGDRNDLALAAVAKYPGRFAIMGRIDLLAAGAAELLTDWRKQPGMLGLRCTFTRTPLDQQFAEGKLDWFWSAAEKASVPVMTQVPQPKLKPLMRVAERFPRLKLVMDHFGLHGDARDEEAFRHFGNILAMAKWPNVAVKASALPFYATDGYPFRRVHPFVRQAYDAFGPKRMFWGTDLSRLPCPYEQAITMFTEEMPWLSSEDKKWIMGRGVCEWLGWELPGEKGTLQN